MMSEQLGSHHESTKNHVESMYVISPVPPAPSVRFFTETESGKAWREKIRPSMNKVFADTLKDLNDPNSISSIEAACNTIGLAYYTGHNYAEMLSTLFSHAEPRLTNSKKFNGHDLAKITKLYRDLNLPPDAITDKIESSVIELVSSGDIHSTGHFMMMSDDSKILNDIGTAHLNYGHVDKAHALIPHIQDPLEQSRLLFRCNEKTVADPKQRQEIIETFTTDVLSQQKKHNQEVLYMATAFSLRNNHYEEAQKYTKQITSPSMQLYAQMKLSEALYAQNKPAEAKQLLDKAQQEFTKHTANPQNQFGDDYIDPGNFAARLVSSYAAQGHYSEARNLLKAIGDRTFQIDLILENIDSRKVFENEGLHDFLLEFMASPAYRKNQIHALDREGAHLAGMLGFTDSALTYNYRNRFKSLNTIDEAMLESLERKDLSGIMGSLIIKQQLGACRGINERETFMSNHPDKIHPLVHGSLKRVITRDDIAFGIAPVIPKDFDYSYLPNHIKLAIELGKNIDTKRPVGPSLLELADPQSIRVFLRGMERYDFKSVPDALTTIVGTLPPESERVVYDYIEKNPAVAPRILKTLVSTDLNQGSRYAINFINRKSTPDKIFEYFCRLLTKDGRFSKNALPLLKDPENTPHLRKLLAQHPNQFNNAVDCMAKVGATSFNQEPLIWNALAEMSPISPRIYTLYRNANPSGREQLAERLKNFNYDEFFKNKPVNLDAVSPEQRELELELIFRAYNPVNMSFDHVAQLFEQVPDRTGDLKHVSLREHYPVSFKTPYFVLNEGEQLNRKTFSKLEFIGSKLNTIEPVTLTEELKTSLLKLVRATTDFSESEVAELLGVMRTRHAMNVLSKNLEDSTGGKTYTNLMSAREALGLNVKDYFATDLNAVLETDPKFKEQIATILSRDTRRKNLLFALGYHEDNQFTQTVPPEQLVAELFSDKVLGKYITLINKEAKKFTATEQDSENDQQARVFISKNKASFFAKASAGLCTSGDITLWNNPNHFHINTIDAQNIVRGSTMGYLETINGKKSLVLRGFNPTEIYLNDISSESFVTEMLKVAKQFMDDNQIADLYITGGDGGFSSLTNRSSIQPSISKWVNRGKPVNHSVQLSGSSSTTTILRLDNFDKWL